LRTSRAVALLGVTVVVAVVLLHHVGGTATAPGPAVSSHAATSTTTTVPASTTTTTTVPPIPPSQVKLLVLNGTGAGELATETGKALAASSGYDTLAPDNTTATVTTSSIYAVTPAYVGAADALASRVGLPVTVVATPVPASAPIRPTERSIADVVLVIGPGFTVPSATPAKAATSTAATPTAATPTASPG
jgi:hypothetical protein